MHDYFFQQEMGIRQLLLSNHPNLWILEAYFLLLLLSGPVNVEPLFLK